MAAVVKSSKEFQVYRIIIDLSVFCLLEEMYTPCYINLSGATVISVAVSRGYDTCFAGKACDGLYQLQFVTN